MDNRLRLCMKKPVFWPALDAVSVLSERRDEILGARSKSEAFDTAWRIYAETLLDCCEHCMEACENIREITSQLGRYGLFHLDFLSGKTCILTDNGEETLSLNEASDGSVMLGFGACGAMDISDFGPSDAAAFILEVFKARKPVRAALGNTLFSHS